MNTLHIATYNRTSEIFDTREEAEAFAAEMNDDSHPFKTTIREIDFEEAFDKAAHDTAWERAFVVPIAREMKKRGVGYMVITIRDDGKCAYILDTEIPENT